MNINDLIALRTGQKAIGIVADSEAKGSLIRDAMHLLKFLDIRSFANFFELSAAVDKRAVHWVYTSCFDQEGEALASYLPQLTAHPTDMLAVVVMLKEAEKTHIPLLFNSGLLHWVDTAETPDAIAQNLYRFIKAQEQLHEDPSLQAFQSLRNYLRSEKRWAEISGVAEKLLQLHPHDDLLRLHQIEALAKEGNADRARRLLLDLDLYDSKLAPMVAQLRASLLQQDDNHHKLLALQFEMRSALIVDPLDESLTLIEAKCRELGFRDLHLFKDGAEAAKIFGKVTIDFAVIEWQSPTLSGPFLVQRLREHGPPDLPIIIISDKLDRSDIQLVKDMGVAQVLRRPLNSQQFTIAAAWAISQAKAPTEASSIERKLLADLAQGDVRGAEQLLRKYQAIASRDTLKDQYFKACLAYHRGRYAEAKKLLLELTHRSKGDNIQFVALLAKCLIRLGDAKTALLLLKRITSFSPKNLDRLCSLASVALENNEVQLAEESLIAAEALDPDAKQVQETKVKVAVASGQTQAIGDTVKLLADIEGVIAHINNMAVSIAKSSDYTEAVRLYKNCLKIIPPEKDLLKAIVCYNLGLALVKNREPQLGSVYLKQSVDCGPSTVYTRAESLYERVLEARRQGHDPVLNLPEATHSTDNDEEMIDRATSYIDIETLRERHRLLKGMVTLLSPLRQAS